MLGDSEFCFALLFLSTQCMEGKVVGEREVSGMKRKEMNLIKTHYMHVCNGSSQKRNFNLFNS